MALMLILLLLVFQFNSIVKPLIIILSIFLSFIGVFLGLIIFNMTFVIILTLFVLLEKLLPVPESMESLYFRVITIVPGILLIAWGISFLI